MKDVLFIAWVCFVSVCFSFTFEACTKNETQNVSDSSGWMNEDFTPPFSPKTVDYGSRLELPEGITGEQFNLIYGHYTGLYTAEDFAAILRGELEPGQIRDGQTQNTIIRKGLSKRIKSNPGITEYLAANLGEYQDYSSSTNYYTLGSSGNKVTWQDIANSAFAESLTELTDFNPELIDWENMTFYSGCTFAFNYDYPITLNTGQVIAPPGECYMRATCYNENVTDGIPSLPLQDYYIEIPGLGPNGQLYINN